MTEEAPLSIPEDLTAQQIEELRQLLQSLLAELNEGPDGDPGALPDERT